MNRISKALLYCSALVALALSGYSQSVSTPSPTQTPAVTPPVPSGPPAKPPTLVSPNAYSGIMAPVAKGPAQPVMIMLYSRFYDHTGPQYTLERINTLLPMLRRLRQQYPEAKVSTVFEFSGSISEVLAEMSELQPELQHVKDAVAEGLIEVGYTGEDEPTYANRPRADFLLADTPEKRWAARMDAAGRFLNDYKDPITGEPVPGLSGGLKRMREVFGSVSYATGITDVMGDNSPYVHQLRQMKLNPVLQGLPDNDPIRGVVEYRFGVTAFAKLMAPLATTPPEVFWEDNVLHTSEVGGMDTQSYSTDNGPEALQAAFSKMDRSRIRVVHMEIGSYMQYLKKGADGTPMYPPLAWAYSHPATPEMPSTLKTVVDTTQIMAARKKEQDSLDWLFKQFLPANPGSRIVSVKALREMVPISLDANIDKERLRLAATDLVTQFGRTTPTIPGYAKCEGEYFSLSDMFGLLSAALAEFSRSGSLPPAVRLTNIYGPGKMSPNMEAAMKEFSVEAIGRAAAGLSDALHDQTWQPVPRNAVPDRVTVDGVSMNPAQFLMLMAQAYLDPTPGRKLKLERTNMVSLPANGYPRRIDMEDMGMGWTLKPAVFQLPNSGPGGAPPPPLPGIR